jgi:hypothetical protein
LPFVDIGFLGPVEDQSFLARFVKGGPGIAAMAGGLVPAPVRNCAQAGTTGSVISVTPISGNHRAHRLFACEITPVMACLAADSFFSSQEAA